MGGGGSEIEESKRSSVDIDNILDLDGAPARRILCLEVIQRPCSYKIWGGCKGRLFRKMRCSLGVVGYPVSVGKYVRCSRRSRSGILGDGGSSIQPSRWEGGRGAHGAEG